jgi:hypothetical protein
MRSPAWLCAASVLFIATVARAETVHVDLKSGLSAEGQLIEYVPADHLTLRRNDGRMVTIGAVDIESVKMDGATAAHQALPVLVQQPVPQRYAAPPSSERAPAALPLPPGRYPRRIRQFYAGFSAGYAPTWADYGYYYDSDYGGDAPLVNYGGTVGLQVAAALVWRNFGLGLELRYTSYGKSKSVGDSDGEEYDYPHLSAVEGLVKPRVGHKLSDKPLDLYFAAPHGFGGVFDSTGGGATFVIGLAAGATWFFRENLGASAELGFTWRLILDDYSEALREFTFLRVSFAAGST